ncbi:MAG: hypothetical protein AAGK23_12710, partial [Pseudomonadota bacterium]
MTSWKMKSVAALAALSLFPLALAQETETDEASDPIDTAAIEQAKADTANWRAVDPENLLIFETTQGRVLIEAFPEI